MAKVLCGLSLAAGIAIGAYTRQLYNTQVIKTRIPISYYVSKLQEGFVTTEFSVEEIEKQWQLDKDRITLLEYYKGRYYAADVLPFGVSDYPVSLYRVLLATCTQVGPAILLDQAMKAYPNHYITHPAHKYDCVLKFKGNALTYEVHFNALDKESLVVHKSIKALLIVSWSCDGVESVDISLTHVPKLF